MASETVRINSDTHDKLKALADQAGEPMTSVLDDAIELLYRERFFDECDRAYQRLTADPKKWRQHLAEREAWDSTLLDGLEDA
jgi:predicted transcriptional regulator